MGFLKLSSWFCLLLIFSANVLPSSCICLIDPKYVIRSTSSPNLVLDSTMDRVTLASFTGANTQLWCLEYTASANVVNIVSVDPLGRALDAYTDTVHAVYLNARHFTSVMQQWTDNSDHTIANVGAPGSMCLGGYGGTIEIGNTLQLVECGEDAEKWQLEKIY